MHVHKDKLMCILHLLHIDVVCEKKVDQTNSCIMRYLIQTVLSPLKESEICLPSNERNTY